MRHDAIRKVYSNAKMIDDSAGVFDFDGNRIQIDDNLIQAKIAELQAAEPLRLLRIERDRLIQQTDWWVLPDRTATPAQLAYRQALRDLPANCTPALDENGNLTGVEWPVYSEEA